MSKEKYSIDELYVDLSSIYSDYERGKINKELVTETASNIFQAFIIGKKFSDAELDIIEEKICPDCKGDLTYDQADPSGKDADIYFCEDCMEKDFPTDNDQDLPLSKEYHISYERRAIGYHVEIV